MIKGSIFIDSFIYIKFHTEGYRSGHNEAVLKCLTAARQCKTATSERGSKHAVFQTVKYLPKMISIENSKGGKNTIK